MVENLLECVSDYQTKLVKQIIHPAEADVSWLVAATDTFFWSI